MSDLAHTVGSGDGFIVVRVGLVIERSQVRVLAGVSRERFVFFSSRINLLC